QPERLDELVHLLDVETRLITPTAPLGTEAASPGKATHYQLTHDYLVPPLRAWLTMRQRETLRGRMALRLGERAAEWNAQPQPRPLPNWWELPAFLLWTKRSTWGEPDRRMLAAARRYYSIRGGLGILLLTIVGWLGWLGWDRFAEQSRQGQAI